MTEQPPNPPAPQFGETGPTASDLRTMLSQPYRHLARGGSVQVYRSADGHYVLKTLASADDIIAWHASDGNSLADLPWTQTPEPSSTGGANDDSAIAERIRAATLQSFRLAERRLRRQCGLLHVHFPSENSSLPLIDCDDGVIDPGREPIVLQCHAERVDAALARFDAIEDDAACRGVIDDIIALVRDLWSQGIAEQTLNFHNNYGYVGERLILLDVGDLCDDRDIVMDHARQAKILQKKSAIWLRQHDPKLAAYLAQQVQRLLSPEVVAILWQNAAR